MSDLSHRPAIRLTWFLADVEACRSGSEVIAPIHFLLACLRVLDGDHYRAAKALDLSEKELAEVKNEAADAMRLLRMSVKEITLARRQLRKLLRGFGDSNAEVIWLHRSEESRRLFEHATNRVEEDNKGELDFSHLLSSLIHLFPSDCSRWIKCGEKNIISDWPDVVLNE